MEAGATSEPAVTAGHSPAAFVDPARDGGLPVVVSGSEQGGTAPTSDLDRTVPGHDEAAKPLALPSEPTRYLN